MKNIVLLLAATVLLVGYHAKPSSSSAAPDERLAKCGNPPVIYLTDGRVQDASEFSLILPEAIASVSITCTDVRHVILGVEAGRSLILTRTKSPSAGEFNRSLDAIASLLEAHFRQHRTYARSLAELGWRESTKASLCVSEDGLRWTLLVADETGSGALSGGRAKTGTDNNGRFSCDVRYPGAEETLHWVSGEK